MNAFWLVIFIGVAIYFFFFWCNSKQGITDYEQTLKARGINYHKLPASLNGKICSYASQEYKRIYSGRAMELNSVMRNVAEHTACCILGPSKYLQMGGHKEFTELKRIANDWKTYGYETSVETIIIHAISEEKLLHPEYQKIFTFHLQGNNS